MKTNDDLIKALAIDTINLDKLSHNELQELLDKCLKAEAFINKKSGWLGKFKHNNQDIQKSIIDKHYELTLIEEYYNYHVQYIKYILHGTPMSTSLNYQIKLMKDEISAIMKFMNKNRYDSFLDETNDYCKDLESKLLIS